VKWCYVFGGWDGENEQLRLYLRVSYISIVLFIHIFIICCGHVLVQVLTASSGKAQKQQMFLLMARKPQVGQDFLIIVASQSHPDVPVTRIPLDE
jgi:hypothetical protein